MSRDFQPPFCHDSTPFGLLINRLHYFQTWFRFFPRYPIPNWSPRCAAHRWDKKFVLINQYFILQILSFMIDVFTPKRISPDCLVNSKWRIWFCFRSVSAIYLLGMLHTVEMISAVCCTSLRSSLWCIQRSSLRYDAHRGNDLRGMLHTAEMIKKETKNIVFLQIHV